MPATAFTFRPAALPCNPVWRSYKGGGVLRAFRGKPGAADDHFPEDWLASTVLARNGKNQQSPAEGVSALQFNGSLQALPQLLFENPAFWFGAGSEQRKQSLGGPGTGVLWKLLDSSVRLQVQAHPNRAFARQHLGSSKGKTECWHILSTRGNDAYVYLAFQNPPTKSAWKRMIQEQNVPAILSCFEPIPVKAGQTYVIPAGTPHAIGEGVFMMELQEPTDWVVRCETVNAGLKLPPEACFMGLDLDRCLDVFEYKAQPGTEVRQTLQQRPKALRTTSNFREEECISREFHEFFRLHRLHGTGEASWPGTELMLLIVLRGEASLSSGDDAQRVQKGETWLLPGAADQWRLVEPKGDWEILLAKLPLTPHAST